MSTALRGAPGPLDYTLLVGLALVWGGSFPLSKVAVEGFPPVTLTLCRQLIAVGILFLAMMVLRRQWRRPERAEWLLIGLCALMSSVLPFTLINWAVERVDSGLAAILMGFMPLLTVVLAHFLLRDEKLTWPKSLGVMLGIVGLCILFWPALQLGGETLWRQIALIGAASCYAINALAMRRLTHWPMVTLLFYIGLGTVILLLPIAFLLEQPLSIAPTSLQVAAMVALALFASLLGAFLMFVIIERQGAGFFGQINLLVPVAGVVLGVVLLGERLDGYAMVALAIIFSGIAVARLKPATLKRLQQG